MSKPRSANRIRRLCPLVTASCLLSMSCLEPDRILPGEAIVTVEPGGPFRISVGYLIVYTETRPFLNGDITYYPHKPYKIYDEEGQLVRHVANHRSNYDEKPTTVELQPGKYYILPEAGGPSRPRIAVVIREGELTKVDVESILKAKKAS